MSAESGNGGGKWRPKGEKDGSAVKIPERLLHEDVDHTGREAAGFPGSVWAVSDGSI